MVKFGDEDKQEIAPVTNGFFDEGVYPVQIVSVLGGVTDKGSEFFEFELTDDDGREGKARLYFTDASKKYSFNTIRGIFVHNTAEEKRDAVRERVNACEDTKDLLKICEALRGKSAWLLVQYTGDTYTSDKTGKVYKNVNRNLYHYEPSFTPTPVADEPSTSTAKDTMGGGDEVTDENVDEMFPF